MNGTTETLNLVYTLEGKIYVNLTNLCSNRCLFCIRNLADEIEGKNLWLSREDFTIDEFIEQFKRVQSKNSQAKEVVYCGYGEPLMKFDIFIQTANFIKNNFPNLKIRVNTNGQANLIHKRNIVPELAKYVDAVSISLNGESREVYNRVSCPGNKDKAYDAVKSFIKTCVEAGIKTTATVVSGYENAEINIQACEEITKSLGANFRVRKWLPAGY